MNTKLNEESEVIHDPNYGDYDFKNSYLMMNSKEEDHAYKNDKGEIYRVRNVALYTLNPDQSFLDQRHEFVRLVTYLFSKGMQELCIFCCYSKNLDFEIEIKEMIYPDMTEKEWKRVCDLIVDSNLFSVYSDMTYKGEVFNIFILGDGVLKVESINDIAFKFNEVLEHMEDVRYENIRNFA